MIPGLPRPCNRGCAREHQRLSVNQTLNHLLKENDAVLFIDRKGRRYLKILRRGQKITIRGEIAAGKPLRADGRIARQTEFRRDLSRAATDLRRPDSASAARRAGDLSERHRTAARLGRRLSRGDGDRGRRRRGRIHDRAAARGRPSGTRDLVRTARGFCGACAAQRRHILRRRAQLGIEAARSVRRLRRNRRRSTFRRPAGTRPRARSGRARTASGRRFRVVRADRDPAQGYRRGTAGSCATSPKSRVSKRCSATGR